MNTLATGAWFREDVVKRADELGIKLVDHRSIRDNRFDILVMGKKYYWFGSGVGDLDDKWYHEILIREGDKHLKLSEVDAFKLDEFTFRGSLVFRMKNKLDEAVMKLGGVLRGPVMPTKL